MVYPRKKAAQLSCIPGFYIGQLLLKYHSLVSKLIVPSTKDTVYYRRKDSIVTVYVTVQAISKAIKKSTDAFSREITKFPIFLFPQIMNFYLI